MSDEPRQVDWKNVSVQLSASNARLCDIALKADELAKAVEALLADDAHTGDANCQAGDCDSCPYRDREPALQAALDNYKIVRNGQ